MHFPRIAFSQRCLFRESRFYQRSFSHKKCIFRRFAFFAISISAQSHFSDYPAGTQIALWSGAARSGCRHDAKRRGGRASEECWRYYQRRAVGSEVGVFVRGARGDPDYLL